MFIPDRKLHRFCMLVQQCTQLSDTKPMNLVVDVRLVLSESAFGHSRGGGGGGERTNVYPSQQ